MLFQKLQGNKPKIVKRKIKQSQPKQSNSYVTNPIVNNRSESSEEAKADKNYNTVKVVAKHQSATKKQDSEDEYDEEYDNEFDEDQQQEKEQSEDEYAEDDDFENDNPKSEEDKHVEEERKEKSSKQTSKTQFVDDKDNSERKDIKENKRSNLNKTKQENQHISKLQGATPKNNKSFHSTAIKSKPSEKRVGTTIPKSRRKEIKGSLFNARVSTGGKGDTRRDRDARKPSHTKHSINRNKSSTASKQTRPHTYGNKSLINKSDNIGSLSQILPRGRSYSKRRLSSKKDKRSRSRTRSVQRKRPSKEQEILITKTYDLSLDIQKKSIHKKISYVNKDDRE